jgi:hypothetical protein
MSDTEITIEQSVTLARQFCVEYEKNPDPDNLGWYWLAKHFLELYQENKALRHVVQTVRKRKRKRKGRWNGGDQPTLYRRKR